MALVTITNLGGSIRLQDNRNYPDITDVEILKDGLRLTRFGDICRITFVDGIAFDSLYSDYEIVGFDGSITPSDASECYDAIWAVLADYGNTSGGCSDVCTPVGYRLLENGAIRTLESGCSRLLEDSGLPGGGVTNVTATAPLVSTEGTTPNISIPKADSTTDGYLHKDDFAAFLLATLSRKLLISASAASSSEITFDGYFSSEFDTYEIFFQDLLAVTNASDLNMRVGIGGFPSTIQTGATDYAHQRTVNGASGTGTAVTNATVADGQDSLIVMYGAALSNVSDNALSGWIRIENPLGTTSFKQIYFNFGIITSFGSRYRVSGSGVYLSTTPITAISIFSNTGNLATGDFKMYGLK